MLEVKSRYFINSKQINDKPIDNKENIKTKVNLIKKDKKK